MRWKISLFPAIVFWQSFAPVRLLSCVASTYIPNACLSCIQAGFFKSSSQNATSGSIVQCSNLHARQRVGSCDVNHDWRSGGCEFDLPNRPFLCLWSHFTCQTYSCTLWAAACVISLATVGQRLCNISLYAYLRLLCHVTESMIELKGTRYARYQSGSWCPDTFQVFSLCVCVI